jgi:drug/metabolite transporter (DMT)-like permease
MPVWLAFLVALVVNAACSLGGILQKKGIGWQTKGRVRDASWRREFLIWLLGFLLIFSVPVLNFIVLAALSPATVGAIGGSGVAFTALFATLILHEKYGIREIAASTVLIAGCVVFALSKGQEGTAAWSQPYFVLAWVLPFAVAGTAWLVMRARRATLGAREYTGFLHSNPYGAVMGAVSGALGGLMIIIIKLFRIECGTDLLKYPLTPFMYAHLSVAIAGPYIMQLALRHGSMIVVAPASLGIGVIYPVVAAWLVFSSSPHPAQLIGLAMIIGSVLVLAASRAGGKQRAAEVGKR